MRREPYLQGLKWDVRKGYGIYSGVRTAQLCGWIRSGRIQKGEMFVWRSGFSGWRRPEDLPELQRFFRRKKRHPSSRKSAKARVRPLQKRKIRSILLIDDEKEICWLLSDILTAKGYQVFTAHTGREGLSKAERYRPDLIIMDMRLPDISGLQVLSRIRRVARKVPIAMISAYGTDEAVKQAKANGVFRFIHKPFTARKIIGLIKAVSV